MRVRTGWRDTVFELTHTQYTNNMHDVHLPMGINGVAVLVGTMITIVIRTEESVAGARLSIFVLFLVFHKQTTFDMYVFTTPPTVSKSATVTSDTADDTNWSRQ